MYSHASIRATSTHAAKAAVAEVGTTAIVLYVEGGQGVLARVFRVIRLPKSQFLRETRGGRISRALLAYARRKGLEAGIYPGNQFNAVPAAWLDDRDSCQTFVW